MPGPRSIRPRVARDETKRQHARDGEQRIEYELQRAAVHFEQPYGAIADQQTGEYRGEQYTGARRRQQVQIVDPLPP